MKIISIETLISTILGKMTVHMYDKLLFLYFHYAAFLYNMTIFSPILYLYYILTVNRTFFRILNLSRFQSLPTYYDVLYHTISNIISLCLFHSIRFTHT